MVTKNDKGDVTVLKCHLDSTATRYTVKPPLLPKPHNIASKTSPYEVKHQFPSVNLTSIKTIKKTVNQTVRCELSGSDIDKHNEELKNDSDVNSNVSQLKVPVNVNSILENNIIDNENNNNSTINKCTDNDLDIEYQDDSLINDYVTFDSDLDLLNSQLDDMNTTIEDEKLSIASDSTDQSYSVKKKIFNWFGSFGKGKINKQKFRTSFYDSCNEDGNSDKEDNDDNDTDSHSSLDEKPNQKIDEALSIENIESEEIPIREKSVWIVEEFIKSEKVFINVLNLLCKTFVLFVEQSGGDAKLIPSTDLSKIIGTLPQLLSLNEDLLQDLEKRMANWNEHPKIADVIVKKGPFLKLYSTYILNFEGQRNFLDECCQKYPRFLKCVKDFEASDVCEMLTIKHHMLKPVQRLPQYRLLLESYLKNQDKDSIDYQDTILALKIVCDVADHANKSLKQEVSY